MTFISIVRTVVVWNCAVSECETYFQKSSLAWWFISLNSLMTVKVTLYISQQLAIARVHYNEGKL